MRKSLFAIAAAGLSLTLAACGSPSSSSSASSAVSASSSAPAAAGSLTIWVDETRIDAFKTLSETFKTETGVSLNVVQKPSADIKTDFIAQAPTGKGPDLIVGAHDWTGDLVSNGVIAPIELADASSKFNPISIKAFAREGQLFGVPYAIENIGLVRNNKLASSTPATFDELVAQGKSVKGAQFPVVVQQGKDGDPYHLYPLQTSFGASVFKTNDAGEYTNELGMSGAEGEKFAAYLKKLGSEGVLSASIGADQAKQAFLDGKTPYIVTGPWWTGDFVKAGMDISVLPIPSAGGKPSSPFVGVQGVFLSSKSNNALLANQFITFMAKSETQTKLFQLGGRMPALTESANAVQDKILAGFAEAGKEGQPMPAIPEMGAVWTFWGGAEISIIDGKAEPTAAWSTMITNIKSKF